MKRLVLAVFLIATPVLAGDLDVVRQNFVGYCTAAGADLSSQRMIDALGGLESTARSYTAPGFLLSDGSWADINYSETPSGSWGPWDHVRRLDTMAKAYNTPGQSLYHDPLLLTQIQSAFSYVDVFYGPLRLPQGNWWFWTMGVPLDLGPALVLMRGEIDPTIYANCVNDLWLRIGNSPTSKGIVGPTPTGENLVWSGFTHLYLALLRDDPTMLAAVRDAMSGAALPTTGDGIQNDSSFHQHGPQLYTGGYGAAFANDLAQYMLLTRGTSYAVPGAAGTALSNYIADGISWSLYGNYFDASAVGRYVVRPSTTGIDGIAALLESSLAPSSRQAEIRSAAAEMLHSWTWTLPPELAGIASSIERSGAPAAWPNGFRHYELSDYSVDRHEHWFASIKMFSTRTKSGESTNDENLLGSRQSDGRMYLVIDGNEYFGRDIWPALDWTRLPGTTVEQKADTANATYGFGTRSFVGGAGDGRNGVAAMDLAPIGSQLTAKKSWFFFDDAIVFLTNGITCPTANRVETVVNQWPLVDSSSPLQTGGAPGATRWAYLERIGYVFPTPVALQTARETRSGTWASLGGSTDTTPHSAAFVTLWLDHGTNPVNATAAYIILPDTTAATTASWASANPIVIEANTPNASAARDLRSNALGIVFWTPGVMDGFSVDTPSIVYVTGDATKKDLWVADPTNGSGTVRLTLPGVFTTTDAPFTVQSHSTTVLVPRSGHAFHVTLTVPANIPRKRATRR